MVKTGKGMWSRVLVVLVFSLAVVVGLVVLSEPAKFLQVLEGGDPVTLVFALLFTNLPLLVYAFTWQRMLESVDIELSYVNSCRVLLANTFINNVTPFGNVGGEAASTFFISKISGHEPGKIFSAIFSSSLINFFPLFTLLAVGLGVNSYLSYLAGLISLTASIMLLTYLLAGKASRLDLTWELPVKVSRFMEEFRTSLRYIKSSKSKIMVLMGLSHLAAFLDVFGIVLVGAAFGVDLFHPLILLAVPLGRLSNYFPTPGGTGSYEVAFTGLLVFFFNVGAAEAVAVALTYRLLTYYVGLIAGYISAVSLGVDSEIM